MTLCSSHQFGALQSLVTSQQSVILEALKEVGKPCDNSKQARKQAIALDCTTSDYFAFRLVLASSLTRKNTHRDRENGKRVRGTQRKRDHQQQETRSRERERTASAEGEQTETKFINNNNRRKQGREIEREYRKREGRRERNRDHQLQQETRRSDHLRSVQSLAIVAEIGAAGVHLGWEHGKKIVAVFYRRKCMRMFSFLVVVVPLCRPCCCCCCFMSRHMHGHCRSYRS